jgi:hypothetical protein
MPKNQILARKQQKSSKGAEYTSLIVATMVGNRRQATDARSALGPGGTLGAARELRLLGAGTGAASNGKTLTTPARRKGRRQRTSGAASKRRTRKSNTGATYGVVVVVVVE